VKVAQPFKILTEHLAQEEIALVMKTISGIIKSKVALNVQLKDAQNLMKGKDLEKMEENKMKVKVQKIEKNKQMILNDILSKLLINF
jgi:hypothetical protein